MGLGGFGSTGIGDIEDIVGNEGGSCNIGVVGSTEVVVHNNGIGVIGRGSEYL